MINIGQRVKVNVEAGAYKLKDAVGVVFDVNNKELYEHHMLPVQVELEKPYDEHGHRMLRVSLVEIEKEGR